MMHIGTEPIFGWILEASLARGLWWMLPTMLLVTRNFRMQYNNDYWWMKMRKSLKIFGIMSILRSKAEQVRVKMMLVWHMRMIQSEYPTPSVEVRVLKIFEIFKKTVRMGAWTPQVISVFNLDARFGTFAVYYIFQFAVLMMRYDLHNTVIFTLLEARMNIAMTRMHKHLWYTSGALSRISIKYSFRQVVQAILAHDEHFKFLYRVRPFEGSYMTPDIPEYKYVEHMWIWCNRRFRERAIESLPGFAKGCIAFLALMGSLVDPKEENTNARLKCNTFLKYLRGDE